jgi:hypothetical protein
MTVALEQFVRKAATAKDIGFEVETLSDTLLKLGSELHFTQVKRTLSRNSLGAAIAEACDIASLCSPELLAQVKFQVVCERNDANLDFASAQPAAEEGKAYDPTIVARTKQCFDPSEPIRVMSHPALALRRGLAAIGVTDPEGVVREALGLIFDAFDGRDRERVCAALYQVINLIDRARSSEVPKTGNAITAADFEVRNEPRANFVLRHRPRLHDLVEGRMIDRPPRLAALEEAAVRWLTTLEDAYARADDVLPVFWIDGRPGDGKSVLALQLLQRLITGGRLGGGVELQRPEDLEGWLSTAPPLRARQSEPEQAEIAFMDDLAAALSPADLAEIIGRGFRQPPYAALITCGATEHLQGFMSEAARVAITRCTVDAPAEADYRQFSEWLIAQGRATAYLPPEPGESVATYVFRVVSAQSNGTAPELRAELLSMSAYADARAALALNALPVPAPLRLLSDATLNLFARGERGVEFSPEEGPAGVVLGHHQVVWPLFRRWVEEDGQRLAEAWAEDLARGLVALLQEGHVRSARTLLGEVLDTSLLTQRLGRRDIQHKRQVIFITLYAAVSAKATLEQRSPLLRQFLVAREAGALASVERGALTAEALEALRIKKLPDTDRVEIALGLLIGKEPPDEREAALATEVVLSSEPTSGVHQFFVQVARKRDKSRHRPLLLTWLQRHQSRPEIAKVLELAIADRDPMIIELGYGFVRRFHTKSFSGPVLWALHLSGVRHPRYYPTVVQWLNATPDPETAARLYRELLRPAQHENFATRALNWVAVHLEVRGAQEVLRRLISTRDGESVFDNAVEVWLDRYGNTSLAPPLLADLIEKGRFARWALSALRYLNTNEGSSGSKVVVSSVVVRIRAARREDLDQLEGGLSRGEAAVFRRLRHRAEQLWGTAGQRRPR